jgi:hypothetical protein
MAVSTACASTESGTASSTRTSEPVITSTPVITAVGQMPRPIEAYLPSADEVVALYKYQLALQNRCLAAHGVNTTTKITGDVDSFVTTSIRDRTLRSVIYGLFDPANAPTSGYHVVGSTTLGMSMPGGTTPQETIKACRDEAAKPFADGGPIAYTDTGVLPDGGPASAVEDSRYRAVVARWSTCMKDKGYPFTDPLYPVQTYTQTPQPSQEEIAAAQADLRCKSSTNLVGVAMAVQSALDQQYIDRHVTQLTAFRQSVQSLVRTAGQVG